MIRIFKFIGCVAISALLVEQSLGQQPNVMSGLALGSAIRACVYRSLLRYIGSLTPPDVARKQVLKQCDTEIAAFRSSGGKPDAIISDGMKFYNDAYSNLRLK